MAQGGGIVRGNGPHWVLRRERRIGRRWSLHVVAWRMQEWVNV